tara:strand:+ start:183 stop:674 length:492 start_codon:yes stop_codon:yes gene_type:complete
MFHVILFNPQIPPNTGNIIRLCANTGASLHLIHPIGFQMDEKSCRRAGLDYHALSDVHQHDALDDCLHAIGNPRMFAITKFGSRRYDSADFSPGDALLFGAETTGLPESIHNAIDDDRKLALPMTGGNRSLNLANAVSVVLYEAWRRCDFAGMVTLPANPDLV